jgi:hypothetical protein
VDLNISNSTLEAGVAAASYHINTVLELKEVVVSKQANEGDQPAYHRYVSKTEPTPSRLVAVAASINQTAAPISRQGMEGGSVEEVDGGGRRY